MEYSVVIVDCHDVLGLVAGKGVEIYYVSACHLGTPSTEAPMPGRQWITPNNWISKNNISPS
jgi:hypothetical protein